MWIIYILLNGAMAGLGCNAAIADAGSLAAGSTLAPSTTDRILKRIIVSALKLQVDHPDLQRDDDFMNHLHDTMHLLLLFGALNSPQSLETLVSLSSYAIPEADADIYNCVLTNKGIAIKPLLEKALTSQHPNECVENFGSANVTGVSPGVSSAKAAMCLNDATHQQVLKSALHAIAARKVCDVNRIEW
jgi:hypothetical protein